MSGGEIAALIAASAFLLLVGVLAVPILKLRHTVDATTRMINQLTDRTGPLLGDVNTTVDNVNTALGQVHVSLDGVNSQLSRLDTITGHAQQVTASVANIATIVGGAVASPLVKVAAFSYGVRRAAGQRRKADEEKQLRAQLKAERKGRRFWRRGEDE